MARRLTVDQTLLVLILVLVAIGIAMVYSGSAFLAQERYGTPYHFLVRQAGMISIGLIGMTIASLYDYHRLRFLIYPLMLACLLALILVLIPGLGIKAGGARRWLRVAGFQFQPSEFAKPILVIYVSHLLARKHERITEFGFAIVPVLLVAGLCAMLVLAEPDMGGALVLVSITFGLLFLAGARLSHLTGLVLVALPFVYLAIWTSAYRRRRFLAFLDPWSDPLDSGFHVIQSLLALGSGGVAGTGLGQGRQKLFFLPEPHTDFIFSVIGEELGLIGAGAVVLLYALLVVRGFSIGRDAPCLFGTLVAGGLTMLIAVQALIHLGVAVGMLPAKGLALPFVSSGGSSVISTLTAMGVLLNISRYRTRAV